MSSCFQKCGITVNVDIIAGSVSNIRENHIYNTAFAINKNKELINEYDKVHLVPMLREPDFLCGGNVVPEPFIYLIKHL